MLVDVCGHDEEAREEVVVLFPFFGGNVGGGGEGVELVLEDCYLVGKVVHRVQEVVRFLDLLGGRLLNRGEGSGRLGLPLPPLSLLGLVRLLLEGAKELLGLPLELLALVVNLCFLEGGKRGGRIVRVRAARGGLVKFG